MAGTKKLSMLRAFVVVNLALLATATVLPRVPAGTQFITGACKSDADCASDCCGFRTGKCAGAVIAQDRDGGCGFGEAVPNNRAAQRIQGPNASAAPGVPRPGGGGGAAPAPPPANNGGSGKPPGTQFITGPCGHDSDCASGCCGFRTGKCAGAVIAQERDGGCGFGDGTPNNRAAQALLGPNAEAAPGVPKGGAAAPPPPPPANNGGGGGGSGKPPGTQFITGPCANDAECANGCCGFRTGKCAGAIIAQERDGGCGHGDAQPNDNAAKKLRG